MNESALDNVESNFSSGFVVPNAVPNASKFFDDTCTKINKIQAQKNKNKPAPVKSNWVEQFSLLNRADFKTGTLRPNETFENYQSSQIITRSKNSPEYQASEYDASLQPGERNPEIFKILSDKSEKYHIDTKLYSDNDFGVGGSSKNKHSSPITAKRKDIIDEYLKSFDNKDADNLPERGCGYKAVNYDKPKRLNNGKAGEIDMNVFHDKNYIPGLEDDYCRDCVNMINPAGKIMCANSACKRNNQVNGKSSNLNLKSSKNSYSSQSSKILSHHSPHRSSKSSKNFPQTDRQKAKNYTKTVTGLPNGYINPAALEAFTNKAEKEKMLKEIRRWSENYERQSINRQSKSPTASPFSTNSLLPKRSMLNVNDCLYVNWNESETAEVTQDVNSRKRARQDDEAERQGSSQKEISTSIHASNINQRNPKQLITSSKNVVAWLDMCSQSQMSRVQDNIYKLLMSANGLFRQLSNQMMNSHVFSSCKYQSFEPSEFTRKLSPVSRNFTLATNPNGLDREYDDAHMTTGSRVKFQFKEKVGTSVFYKIAFVCMKKHFNPGGCFSNDSNGRTMCQVNYSNNESNGKCNGKANFNSKSNNRKRKPLHKSDNLIGNSDMHYILSPKALYLRTDFMSKCVFIKFNQIFNELIFGSNGASLQACPHETAQEIAMASTKIGRPELIGTYAQEVAYNMSRTVIFQTIYNFDPDMEHYHVIMCDAYFSKDDVENHIKTRFAHTNYQSIIHSLNALTQQTLKLDEHAFYMIYLLISQDSFIKGFKKMESDHIEIRL